ncbi:MAG: DUF1573 domain-containing protein [Paludibacteraceae bacterium]|nr:DUF1573 domain-containing protein [Paludibacteraceae bacterium]
MLKNWLFYTILMVGISVGVHATPITLPTDSLATDSLATDSIQLPPQEATMVFDRQEYHMGRIWDSHKPATYTFFYCNVGLSGLIINRIEATCGCTVLQYPTDSLYYDQSGQIEVAISPCTDKKEFKKGIYVYTNAGTFKLLVSGEFNKPNYQHEDYSAIPTIEEEEKQQLLLNDESTNRGIDESKKKEKSNKKEKRKKKH